MCKWLVVLRDKNSVKLFPCVSSRKHWLNDISDKNYYYGNHLDDDSDIHSNENNGDNDVKDYGGSDYNNSYSSDPKNRNDEDNNDVNNSDNNDDLRMDAQVTLQTYMEHMEVF